MIKNTMNFKIYTIHDDSNRDLVDLLKREFSKIQDVPYLENYHPDFSSNPANIFYILKDKNGRYNRGSYYILKNNDEYICSAGWNLYDYNPEIALALTRAYVSPIYRTKFYEGIYIIPEIIKAATKQKAIWITLNQYNYSLYKRFTRGYQGKSTGISSNWPEIYKKFKPSGKQVVNGVEQWILEYVVNQ